MNVNVRKQPRLNENFSRKLLPLVTRAVKTPNLVRLTLESSKIIEKRQNRIESDHMKLFFVNIIVIRRGKWRSCMCN